MPGPTLNTPPPLLRGFLIDISSTLLVSYCGKLQSHRLPRGENRDEVELAARGGARILTAPHALNYRN
jgi:hypothetical protein